MQKDGGPRLAAVASILDATEEFNRRSPNSLGDLGRTALQGGAA